jgi:hypothetical protein
VNSVVDAAIVSYVRNDIRGELLCKCAHVLLYVLNRNGYGLLNLFHMLLGFLHLGDWELELSCLHDAVVRHQLLTFLLRDYFFGGLFRIRVEAEGRGIKGIGVQKLLHPILFGEVQFKMAFGLIIFWLWRKSRFWNISSSFFHLV